jgi:hypothetical protein
MEGRIMMTAAEAAEAARGLTFEKVWATMQELSREADRRRAELDQVLKENSEKADRRRAELDQVLKEISEKSDRRQAETDRQIQELSQNVGGLNNSLGKWAEETISTKLWEKFRALGYTFTHGGPHEYWEGGRTVCQVDALLENGEYVMPVEVKSELGKGDVDKHLERIGKVREQLDKRGDRRKLVGAVAGMVVGPGVREYAQERGLYVLVQSGDSMAVAELPENFKPREW